MTSANTAHSKMPTTIKRLMRVWLVLVAVIIGMFGVRLMSTEPVPPPEDFGVVPAFELTDQSGRAFGSKQLMGSVWVANFIFTRCTTVCPVFSTKMAALRDRAASPFPDLRLVSFSVDPEYDTPEVLMDYSRGYEADPDQWFFLTGKTKIVRSVVTDGMMIYMGDASEVESPEALMHGSHFVLIDGTHTIRGFYQVDDADAVDRLLRDIELLEAENE